MYIDVFAVNIRAQAPLLYTLCFLNGRTLLYVLYSLLVLTNPTRYPSEAISTSLKLFQAILTRKKNRNVFPLVGGWANPSEKYKFVSWGYFSQYIWKVIKAMIQTTRKVFPGWWFDDLIHIFSSPAFPSVGQNNISVNHGAKKAAGSSSHSLCVNSQDISHRIHGAAIYGNMYHQYTWANYNNSLIWIKAIKGDDSPY